MALRLRRCPRLAASYRESRRPSVSSRLRARGSAPQGLPAGIAGLVPLPTAGTLDLAGGQPRHGSGLGSNRGRGGRAPHRVERGGAWRIRGGGGLVAYSSLAAQPAHRGGRRDPGGAGALARSFLTSAGDRAGAFVRSARARRRPRRCGCASSFRVRRPGRERRPAARVSIPRVDRQEVEGRESPRRFEQSGPPPCGSERRDSSRRTASRRSGTPRPAAGIERESSSARIAFQDSHEGFPAGLLGGHRDQGSSGVVARRLAGRPRGARAAGGATRLLAPQPGPAGPARAGAA